MKFVYSAIGMLSLVVLFFSLAAIVMLAGNIAYQHYCFHSFIPEFEFLGECYTYKVVSPTLLVTTIASMVSAHYFEGKWNGL